MMFNNDYFSKPNTSYSLFDLVDPQSGNSSANKNCCKLLASNNPKLNSSCPTMFDFEDPLKYDRLLDSNYEDVDGTCYSIDQINDLFPLNEPTRFIVHKDDSDKEEVQELGNKSSIFNNSSLPSSTVAPTLIPKHKVIVEQAPFSVMKSFKSQEPIEKANNVQVISSLRNHPYNNSKSRPITSTTDTFSNINTNIEEPEKASAKSVSTPDEPRSTSDSSDLLLKKSDSVMAIDRIAPQAQPQLQPPIIPAQTINTTKSKSISRNSSSNAILAHLRSISPNFKSIFVRPKNVKPIDSSSIMNKSKVHYKNVSIASKQHDSSILPLLYSNSTEMAPSPNSLFTMMHNIEPKEIRLNSSVDDVLRKFSDDNGIISKTLKNLSNSTSVSSTISSVSTPIASNRGDRTVSATSSIRSALNQTIITPPTDSTNNRQTTDSQVSPSSSLSSTGNTSREKWTCMICLSKHPMRQDICAICGSEKPTTTPQQSHQVNYSQFASSLKHHQHVSSISPVAVSPSNELFSSYLIKELGLKHKISTELGAEQDKPASSMAAQLAPKVNPYLKKWTCPQCNFSNDSLKIVCLNCRWMKTSPGKKETNEIEGELASAKETKRAKAGADTPLNVDTASVAVCSSCKSPIGSEDVETPAKTSVEPKKLDFGAEVNVQAEEKKSEPTPNLLFGKLKSQTPKWTCGTCLVSNEDTADKCACCSSAKPGPKPTSTPATIATTVPATKAPEPTSLFNKISSSQGKTSSKWTCDTCLVSNAEVNEKCACCMTPRPSSKPAAPTSLSSITKPSPFASASAKWTCDTCLVSNDSDKTKCVCCQTDKPGAAKSTPALPTLPQLTKGDTFKAPETSAIKFGSSTSTTSETSSAAPITFGASSFSFKPTSESTASSAAPAFKFGSDLFKAPPTSEPATTAAKTTTDEQPAKKPAFSFAPLGTNQESTTPATTSMFKFGQPPAQPEPKPKTTTTTTEAKSDLSTSSFLSTLSTLAGPAKPVAETTSTSSFPAFKAFGETATASTTTAAKKPEESISTFKFGETTTTSQAATKAPSFSFGSTSSATPSFTFGGASTSSTTGAKESAPATTTATQPASSFSLFSQNTESKPATEAKPLTFGATTSTGSTGFGLFGKPTEQQSSQSQPTSTLGSFFNNISDKPATSANTTTTTTTTPILFGNTAETPKLSFGNLSSTGSTTSLFGSKPAENKPAIPTFGQSTSTTSTTGSTGGLFSSLANQPQQQQQTATSSFNFFSTPPSANTTPSTATPAQTNSTPSIFSTQTLTPNSANMQPSNNSFQFTPLPFNNNQQQPNPFVPNLAPPVINFTATNPSGFVFSGSSDQQQQPTTDLIAQRRRAKAVRRQRQ